MLERIRGFLDPNYIHVDRDTLDDLRRELAHSRFDDFTSPGLGLGTSDDKRLMFEWRSQFRLAYQTLDSLYRSSGLIQRIVDKPANNMTREGISIKHPECDRISSVMEDLRIMQKINQALKWSRIYRGSAVVMDIDDGQDISQPVNTRRIRRIGVSKVLDSSYLIPDGIHTHIDNIHQIETFFMATNTMVRVHRSRMLIFDGFDAGPRNRQSMSGWGESQIDAIFQPFMNYVVDHNSASSLVKDFGLAIFRLSGFASKTNQNTKEAVASAKNRIKAMRKALSIVNGLVMDAEDNYERKTTNVQGLDKIINLAKDHLAAVSGIPRPILFNEDTKGVLGDAGGTPMRIWYDIIRQMQTDILRPELNKVILYIAAMMGIDESIPYDFNSLWQMTRKEKAEVQKIEAETDLLNWQMGAIAGDQIAMALKERGTYSARVLDMPPDNEVDRVINGEDT